MRTNIRTNIRKHVKGQDRLSDLHDDILIHILSFLNDVKFAAQTCVLSKRWNKKLWIHHPDVYLHSKTFGESSHEFENFVDMVLTQRDNFDHKLRSFSFCWTFESKIPQQLLDRVHSHAQSRDVRHFYLSIGYANGHRIYPSQNFNPKSLTSLRLNLFNCYQGYLCVDSNLDLQNIYLAGCTALKILWLEYFIIHIKSDDVDLFSSLTNLTELGIITSYIVGKDARFHIRAPRLERLTVMNREIFGPAPYYVISSPMLKYLKIDDLWESVFSQCHLPSLEELEVNFHSRIESRNSLCTYYGWRMLEIFKGVPHAKSVTLSKSTLQVLSAFCNAFKWVDPCPKFKWKILKVIKTKELSTLEFPEYLRGLAYLRKRCSKNLKVELIT